MNQRKPDTHLLLNYPPGDTPWINDIFSGFGELSVYGVSRKMMNFRYNQFLSFLNFFAKAYMAFKVIRKSKQNDIIFIYDNTFTGIVSALFSYLFNAKRTILLINMIDHQGSSFFKKIKKHIYKIAFKKVYATVNSSELIQLYTNQYNLPEHHIFELSDSFAGFNELFNLDENTNHELSYDVFCGGSTQRDWQLFFEVARSMPELKFVAIARKNYFDKKPRIPENVELHLNTDGVFFNKKLKQSKICLLPLSTKTQAGQMVIFQAALLKKPVVVTETVAIKNYIRNMENGILTKFKSKEEIIQALINLSDANLRQKLGEKLYNDIKLYSQENFTNGLEKIMAQIGNNQRAN